MVYFVEGPMYHKEIQAVLLVWVSSENEGGLATL